MATPYRGSDVSLGELVSVHASRAGGALYGFYGVAVAALGVWMTVVGVSPWVGGSTIAVAAVGTLVFGRLAQREAGERIALHERGLVLRANGGERSVRFDDVVRITSTASRARGSAVESQNHVVELRAGDPIVFTLLHDGAPELLAAIHEATHERLKLEALREYDAGEVLRFGPFAVTDAGVRHGEGRVIPWSEIERATIELPGLAVGPVWSRIEISKRGRTKAFVAEATEHVPNAEVMVDVVTHAVAMERAHPKA